MNIVYFQAMNRLTILFLLLSLNPAYGQGFKITPNNNQYYSTHYIQKPDSVSIWKITLLFNVMDGYKSTHVNPEFTWNDGSGTLNATMIAPGKYQIDLNVVYKKKGANTIALSEFETPRVIDVKIHDLHRHLIRIDYVSNLTVANITKKISTFYPMESKYNDLISFIYEYNEILRKYDPFCELVFPEIITDDFSGKITQTIHSDWKKIKINDFYTTSKNLSKALKSDPQQQSVSDLIDCLSQTNTIKLNYYNAYRINYLTNLLEHTLTTPEKDFSQISSLILESFQAIKKEESDPSDRNLIITHVTRNGFQVNNLAVAYTPVTNTTPEIVKSKEYFKIPTSPSFSIFSNSEYMLWVENKDKQKVSTDKTVKCTEDKYKEIVLPVHSTLAIVKLQNDFGKNLNYDLKEFQNEIKNLIIKYKCMYLTHISVPVNSKT